MPNLQPNARLRRSRSESAFGGSIAVFAIAVLVLACATPATASERRARLSSDLKAHLDSSSPAPIDIIVSGSQERIDRLARRHGLVVKKVLSSGAVLTASTGALAALAQDVEVDSLSGDSTVRSHMAVTASTTGADAAWAGAIDTLGAVDGRGVGVAIIDSGIAVHPALQSRVVASVDFTQKRGRGQDDYGHGTHIAGIVAARAFRNSAEGAESGIAPAAHLINLKVLGADGTGRASDVIEAMDWAIRYRKEFGIRVVNLSLGAAPTQSYKDDPICQAVERAVKAGLVVVASAGNYGTNEKDQQIYGSVTSPGISPYAITVGAIRTQGTADKSDLSNVSERLPVKLLALVRSIDPSPSGLSVKDLGVIVSAQLRRITSARSIVLYGASENGHSIRCLFANGPLARLTGERETSLGERLSGWVAAHRAPIWNSDATLDIPGELAKSASIGLASGVPLVDGDSVRVLSAIGIDGNSAPNSGPRSRDVRVREITNSLQLREVLGLTQTGEPTRTGKPVVH